MRETERFGCGKYSVVGPLKGKPGTFGYMCVFCGSYRCDRCRIPKLKKVRSAIARIASEMKLDKMATLTLDRKKMKGQRSDRYIRNCWRKMRVSLARKFGESVDYVGVLEFHKDGVAHLHLLLNQFIEQGWLSDAWSEVGGGVIVDIRLVDIHRVTAYLSVYLTGDKVRHTLELLPKRARIFTTSRSIVLWGKKKTSGWWLRRVGIETFYDAAPNPAKVRFEPVEDLKPFGLEMLSYFESLPLQEALGNRDVITVLRQALPIWKAETL